jgi:hypothetical protein
VAQAAQLVHHPFTPAASPLPEACHLTYIDREVGLRFGTGLMAVVAATTMIAAPAMANGGGVSYDHVGTFEVPDNLRPGEPADTITSAEIVTAVPGGRTLIYTDSPASRIGFVDITRPGAPRAAGVIPTDGEPTSVAMAGSWALVAVNTSESLIDPSGELLVVDPRSRSVVKRIELAGQPDSVAVSPDKRYAAIVIENERDEDVDDGLIPQQPAGTLQILELPWLRLRTVPLTGLADYAPSDPEPEFVDINRRNEAIVSLQENNHFALVDVARAKVKRDFPAGSATVRDIDATEEELGPQDMGLIELDETITRRREPDAVHWIDDDTFATANEGDYTDENGVEGGSRSFTLFRSDGRVEYEAGSSFEHEIVRAGHFPQARAENKGVEPEGLEVVEDGHRKLLLVGSERANAVGVYDVSRGAPRFLHVIPTGIGPEGIKAIPERDLVAVSAETDLIADDIPIRPLITLYELGHGTPGYPEIVSADDSRGVPTPWVALSGLSGDPRERDTVWGVSDSYLAQGAIYRIDVDDKPAVIEKRIGIAGTDFDLEGISARREGGFWLASEGRTNAGSSRPNLLVRTDSSGTVLETVPLPASLTAFATSSGFEGVAVTGSAARRDETVYAVIQREWGDDAPGFVKLARYEVAAKRWTFARYPLGPVESPAGGWVGLSEITLLGDGRTAAIVERDDRIAGEARVKRIFTVDLEKIAWRAHGQPLDTARKTLLRDVIDELDEHSISIPDKLEGTALTRDGRFFLATDNDGVDENYGETLFFQLR